MFSARIIAIGTRRRKHTKKSPRSRKGQKVDRQYNKLATNSVPKEHRAVTGRKPTGTAGGSQVVAFLFPFRLSKVRQIFDVVATQSFKMAAFKRFVKYLRTNV